VAAGLSGPIAIITVLWLGLLLGLLIPQPFATFTAYAAGAALDYAPLLLAASAGSVGNAGLMLYPMSLYLDAILPRAARAQASCAVRVLAVSLPSAGWTAASCCRGRWAGWSVWRCRRCRATTGRPR
jgi:hypothetical protein